MSAHIKSKFFFKLYFCGLLFFFFVLFLVFGLFCLGIGFHFLILAGNLPAPTSSVLGLWCTSPGLALNTWLSLCSFKPTPFSRFMFEEESLNSSSEKHVLEVETRESSWDIDWGACVQPQIVRFYYHKLKASHGLHGLLRDLSSYNTGWVKTYRNLVGRQWVEVGYQMRKGWLWESHPQLPNRLGGAPESESPRITSLFFLSSKVHHKSQLAGSRLWPPYLPVQFSWSFLKETLSWTVGRAKGVYKYTMA